MSGHKQTEETRERLRQIRILHPVKYWLGKKRSPESRERMRIAKLGTRHTEEWKQKNSIRMMGNNRGFKKGVKPINWKGDEALSRRAKIVLLRDEYTCRTCGMVDLEIMQVDHILEKALGGNDSFDNLQTLCPNCHARKTIRFMKVVRLSQKK